MTEVVGLTEDSLLEKEKNDMMLMELEIKKRAFQMVDPTLSLEVQKALRSINQPIRLFGEDASDTRQRLRVLLAYRSILQDRYSRKTTLFFVCTRNAGSTAKGAEYVMKYTDGYGNICTRLVDRPDLIAKVLCIK